MTNTPREKKVYNGIDLCKLICAILIVLLHAIETTAWYPNEVKYVLTRFAVPFFFITSGFFFYNGLNKAKDKTKYFIKYEKNLLKIFAVWALLIYSPYVIYSYVQSNAGESVIKIILMLIRRIFIIGPGPYWYLVALMWSALFLYICYKKDWNKLIYAGILIGFTLEIMYACFKDSLSNIIVFDIIFKAIYAVFSYEFNFTMFGIPFMGIGFLIAKNDFNIKLKTSSILFVITTLLCILEYNLPKIFSISFFQTNKISFAFILQSVAFFMVAKNMKFDISKSKSLAMRQLSSTIYFAHAIILYNIMNPLLGRFTDWPIYSAAFILPKVVVDIFMCCLLYYIVKKINNKHLNILING